MQYAITIPKTVPIIINLKKEFPKKLLKSDAKVNIVTDKIIPGMAYPLIEKFVTADSNLLSVTLIP